MTSGELQAINEQLAADPTWMQLVKQFQAAGRNPSRSATQARLTPLLNYLSKLGLPSTVAFDPETGDLSESWTNSAKGAALLAGIEGAGMLGGAYALPLISGAGGSTALAEPVLTSGLPTGLSAGSMSTATLAGTAPGVAGAAGMAEPLLTSGLPGGLEAGSLPTSTLTGAAPGGGGILSQVGKYAKQLGGIGEGISNATDQAAKNRMAQNDPYIQRARLDDSERSSALRELYGINATMNPTSSPFNPRPIQAPTGSMADTLKAVAGQHETRLKTPGTYNATTLPSLQAGTMEKVGNWAGPMLSTIGNFFK